MPEISADKFAQATTEVVSELFLSLYLIGLSLDTGGGLDVEESGPDMDNQMGGDEHAGGCGPIL